MPRAPAPPAALIGTAESFAQSIRLESDVLLHLRRHRQRGFGSAEAGGQLFGSVARETVRVLRATGPYTGDERSRYRYRSNPAAAQRAIQEQACAGLLYLGEWHTHPERSPTASGLDRDTMSGLEARSRLNCNTLLLLIVGQSEGPEGLSLYSLEGGQLQIWRWSNPLDSRARAGGEYQID